MESTSYNLILNNINYLNNSLVIDGNRMIFNKKAASENEKKTTCSLITSFRKLTGLHIIFCAGLLLCFVPSVSCKSAWSERLAYEKIYNSTNSQIQHINKPYSPASHGPYSHSQRTTPHSHKLSEETKVNEVDDELEHLDDKRGKLLVGFARDPFRYSIPEDDYRNGVRTINPQSYKNQKRSKRAVDNLYDMLSCATGCDPLSYMGYGCYCGLGGSGWPVDAIDRCCRRHDKCYDNIDCPHTVYFQPYFWRCSNGIPVCSFKNLFHTDYECTVGLCACDMEFAMCLSRYSCPSEQARC